MKNYSYVVKSVFARENRSQLITVGTMLWNVGIGVSYIIISMVKLSLFLGFNGAYNIVLATAKFTALSKLLKIKDSSETVKAKVENTGIRKINICTLIASLLFFSFGVVITFFYEDPASYGRGMVFFIAGTAFFKVFAFVAGVIVNWKKRSGVQYYIKLMAGASALISLAVTQRAVLYFIGVPDASILSGVGGMIFSFFAVCIAVFMLLKENNKTGPLISNKNISKDKLI